MYDFKLKIEGIIIYSINKVFHLYTLLINYYLVLGLSY